MNTYISPQEIERQRQLMQERYRNQSVMQMKPYGSYNNQSIAESAPYGLQNLTALGSGFAEGLSSLASLPGLATDVLSAGVRQLPGGEQLANVTPNPFGALRDVAQETMQRHRQTPGGQPQGFVQKTFSNIGSSIPATVALSGVVPMSGADVLTRNVAPSVAMAGANQLGLNPWLEVASGLIAPSVMKGFGNVLSNSLQTAGFKNAAQLFKSESTLNNPTLINNINEKLNSKAAQNAKIADTKGLQRSLRSMEKAFDDISTEIKDYPKVREYINKVFDPLFKQSIDQPNQKVSVNVKDLLDKRREWGKLWKSGEYYNVNPIVREVIDRGYSFLTNLTKDAASSLKDKSVLTYLNANDELTKINKWVPELLQAVKKSPTLKKLMLNSGLSGLLGGALGYAAGGRKGAVAGVALGAGTPALAQYGVNHIGRINQLMKLPEGQEAIAKLISSSAKNSVPGIAKALQEIAQINTPDTMPLGRYRIKRNVASGSIPSSSQTKWRIKK